MNMDSWSRDLQVAAAGITAAAAIELVSGAIIRDEEDEGRLRARYAGHLLLAGGLAAVYSRLVPAPDWGPRSGASFAQLPLVLSAHSRFAPAPKLKLALWGGLMGLLLRAFAA